MLDGAVVLEQPAPKHGYRVNVDAIHLARFAALGATPNSHVVDLGAGVGAVALCFGHLAGAASLSLIEVDANACELARRNLDRAGWSSRSAVLCADVAAVKTHDLRHAPNVLLSNPPYTPMHAGRPSRVAEIDLARRGDVTRFLQCASRLLADRAGGVCAVCYPVQGMTRLLADAARAGLQLQRATFVHARSDVSARLALVAFTPTGQRCTPTITPPWFES